MEIATEDWLRLAAAEGIGPMRWGALMREEAAEAVAESWLRCARAEVPPVRIEALLARCAECDIEVVTPAHRHYPAPLVMIPDPPAVLYVRGDVGVLGALQIAVVGARSASRRGLADAAWIAAELAAHSLVVTSGLALGIDAAAHAAALDAGGSTIAVLGSGLDQVHPRRHLALARRVAQQGALVSEFAPGTPPAPHHFPRRNRIISGLCLGVVVVEASERSGSLITARLAAAQGREVFAMPTTARDPGGAGCHRLIRDGARLLTSLDDLLEELPPELVEDLQIPALREAMDSSGDDDSLLRHFDADGTAFDVLLARSGLAASELNARLFHLELEGRVVRERQRWVRLH